MPARLPTGRIAVVDIGSNSIRLVVFNRLTRSPIAIHNEKASCGLGKSLVETGRLDEDGIACALKNLPRFAALCDAMQVTRIDALGTAAMREAEDGADFAADIERICGFPVRVLSGSEEAHLSALGVLSADPHASGMMGDLGGASLEMVAIDKGRPQQFGLFPIGPMQLAQESRGDIDKAANILKSEFDPPDWFSKIEGRSLYAVGGAWRALARIHIEQTNYPLHVIHGYTLGRDEADKLTAWIARTPPDEIAKLSRGVRDRSKLLPYAALIMRRLLNVARPRRVVFSAFGLREGQVFSLLSEAERTRDPLIAACEDLAEYAGPFGGSGEEILEWGQVLFPRERAEERRLRLAACMLRDLAWREHPDFRAEQAMERIMRMPVVGMDHRARVFLGLALFARYKGNIQSSIVRHVRGLVSREEGERAVLIGRSLRLAHAVSGGVTEVLERTWLEPTRKELVLHLGPGAEQLRGDAVRKALTSMAEIVGRRPSIVVDERPAPVKASARA